MTGLARYGLSVVLKKAYPEPDRFRARAPSDLPWLRGAEIRRAPWKDVPAELASLVRRRIAADPIFRAQVASVPALPHAKVGGPAVRSVAVLRPGVGLLEVEPGAHLTLSDVPVAVASTEPDRPRSEVTLLRVGDGARVRWYAERIGTPGASVVERLVWLGEGSLLELTSFTASANSERENIEIVLGGAGATARVGTLLVGASDNQFDVGVSAVHHSPHTRSDLRTKVVLGGSAQAVTRGLVRVERHARGADGYQRCDALLLTPTAEVDPIPKLEIENADVRCTHGVTVSRLNPDHLFYLKSRGLPEVTAREVLVEGFAAAPLGGWPGARDSLRSVLRAVLRERS